MLGAILALFGFGVLTKENIKHNSFDNDQKEYAIANNKNTYIDWRGTERSIRTKNKVWHITDQDGYRIAIDSKTKEILDDSQRKGYEKIQKENKEKAKRGGEYAYSVPMKCCLYPNIPIDKCGYFRTSDDKPLCKGMLCSWVTPKFHLCCGDQNKYTVDNTRKAIYDYCYDWYVNNNMTTAHPNGIFEEAEDYGVIVYKKDVEYCLEKIKESENGGSGFPVFDLKYLYCDWIPKEMRRSI